jgi:hypothetical protein
VDDFRELGVTAENAKEGLSRAKIALRKIGFVWDTSDAYWDQMYAKLHVLSRKTNGNCSVPAHRSGLLKGEEFKGLGAWVQIQRYAKKSFRGTLTPD